MENKRPKASYLDWFKELMANYKLIAMLFVALGGYSGINLWKDVSQFRANTDLAEETRQAEIDQIVEKYTTTEATSSGKALNAQENMSKYSLIGHTHKHEAFDRAIEKALNAHVAQYHIENHRALHQ